MSEGEPDRCITDCRVSTRSAFESNFPVDRLSFSYRVFWNAMQKLAAGYSSAERDALFSGTATRVYSLDD